MDTVNKALRYIAKKQPSFVMYLSFVQQQLKQQSYLLVANTMYTTFSKDPLPSIFCLRCSLNDDYGCILTGGRGEIKITGEKKLFVDTYWNHSDPYINKPIADALEQRIVITSRDITVWITLSELLSCDLVPLQPRITTTYLKCYDEWQKQGIDYVSNAILSRKHELGNTFEERIRNARDMWRDYSREILDVTRLMKQLVEYELEDILLLREVLALYHNETTKCITQDELEKYFKIGRYDTTSQRHGN